MKVKVKAKVSFAGIRISLHEGQEADIEQSLALSLEKCGYLTIFAPEQKEEKPKESKRTNKRRNMAASERNAG